LGHGDPTVTLLWVDQKCGLTAALPANRTVWREIDVDAFGAALGGNSDERSQQQQDPGGDDRVAMAPKTA
jgi:hypothetical protein